MLSKKDIIELNKEFAEGVLINEGSLDFAVKQTERNKNWLRCSAIFVRAILQDHPFTDGNKRTALAVILFYAEQKNVRLDKEKLRDAVVRMTRKNVKSIVEIERLIKNAKC